MVVLIEMLQAGWANPYPDCLSVPLRTNCSMTEGSNAINLLPSGTLFSRKNVTYRHFSLDERLCVVLAQCSCYPCRYSNFVYRPLSKSWGGWEADIHRWFTLSTWLRRTVLAHGLWCTTIGVQLSSCCVHLMNSIQITVLWTSLSPTPNLVPSKTLATAYDTV